MERETKHYYIDGQKNIADERDYAEHDAAMHSMDSIQYRRALSYDRERETVYSPEHNRYIEASSSYSLDEAFYVNLIEAFVNGEEVNDTPVGDPICDYLVMVMNDNSLRAMVLNDEVLARIFKDNMFRFVDTALRRKRFNFNRKQSEMRGVQESLEWSMQMKHDGNQALLSQLDEAYSEYGFRSAFYKKKFEDKENLKDDNLWESMYKDYKIAFNECLRQKQREDVNSSADSQRKRLEMQMQTIPEYLARHGVEADDFYQAWGMMGGDWNEYDFERFYKMVRLQKVYPELLAIANKMGRIIDPEGKRTMWVGSGNTHAMEHSSKSDIQGVTVGRQLDSLLPVEMVEMADDDLEELFLMKYATNKLQNFLHKSEQLNPNRKLERRRSTLKGPMIVCVDTSGSMQGTPQNIMRSLLLKLIELATRQKRELFVIAFSVSATPIDARRDKAKLLDFFTHSSTGDTNATKMIQCVFQLLERNVNYLSADVLMITDFKMPLVSQALMDRMLYHRQLGTFFYGLQLGEHQDNPWLPNFDLVYKIGYQMPRKF